MNSEIKKLEDGTISLSITIPNDLVKKTWEEVLEETAKSADLAGFRKGKAPKKLVEEKIDKEKVREEVLKKLLPKAYVEAVKEHNINPILNPKIQVEKLEDPSTSSGQDWKFTALTCEVPNIDLNGYKENIQKVTAKAKIIIPSKPFDSAQGKQEEPKFEEIMKAMTDSVTISIPKILIDNEVDRLLSQTLDEIKRLGLSLDQYLASTGKTVDQLRSEYGEKAKNDIKLEFALQKIAKVEKIAVEEKEIDEAIQKAKNEEERKNLQSNRYLLASILRQQKTLDFLKNL